MTSYLKQIVGLELNLKYIQDITDKVLAYE